MYNYRSKTKVIGFDLDQTLYPKSPEIDHAIQIYLYKKIAEYKKCGIKEAEKLFRDLYKEGKGLSGSKSLITLGLPRAKELVQEALEKAEIDEFLKPDINTLNLLNKLKNVYKNIDLLTGSDRKNAGKKLNKLKIPVNTFSNVITADDASKSDGTVYKLWLSLYSQYTPNDFLYVGDRVSSDYAVPKELGIKSILVNVKENDDTADCPQLRYLSEIETYLI